MTTICADDRDRNFSLTNRSAGHRPVGDKNGFLRKLNGLLTRASLFLALCLAGGALPTAASVLFQENFFDGWSVVKPEGEYFGTTPLRWEYDVANAAIQERSNTYTDDSTYSWSAIAPMLINNTVTGTSFTYKARLTAGDNDGFGLIFGYQDVNNFYRITFSQQARTTGYPWYSWIVDRWVNGAVVNLFGYGTPGYVQTFVNTAGVPFDVLISVDAANKLTLTVTNNPTGSSTTFPLVNAQTLPGPASGKVGVVTWGMDGGTPDGFYIQNLSLSPLALTGNLHSMTNWTAIIPPRTVGSSAAQTGSPNWAMAAREGVPTGEATGALEETGDCYQGNDAAGQVDFTGPTQVAGSDTWSNYVVAARITPFDDDGHGIVFRYRNVSNFYRILLRSQVAALGPPPGLSIQKNVGRVYTEIYRDNPVKYDPTPGVPYDLVAQIATNTLNILLVADPEGAATVYNYGPFNVTGVNTGKVGFVSWGMSRTSFDSISVQDGASLYVSSPFGAAVPDRGISSYTAGTLINASVGPVPIETDIRRTPAGWVGTGSVPASGAGSNVSFTINTFSTLHWKWLSEYLLTVSNSVGGTVSFPPGDWFPEGSNVTVMATPAPGYAFTRWTNDSVSTSPTLGLPMTQPYTLTPVFTLDSDGDGLPDEWELAWFTNLTATADGDPDGDGQSNAQELANGTNPTVSDILRIDNLQLTASTGVLTISNNTGTRYNVERAVTLPSNWATLSTLQTNRTYTSPLPAGDQAYWRLSQPARPTDVPAFVPGSWTLVALPDTQIYSESYPELFKDQTRWIVANKERYNIKYVLHLGDIVNVANNLQQWTNAKAAISLMDGQIPYALATGNHDHGGQGANRTTLINDYFPVSLYTNWPTFGGTYEPNRIENSYHLFSAGGVDWLLLSLEWGPRNGSVAWGSMIASNYPTRKKIVITHAYMYYDETRYDWATKGSSQTWNPHSYGSASDPDGTNDGEELWNKLVKIHPGFVMTFNGHVLNDGLGRMSSTNIYGDVVHQMLVNYQMKALGGEAFLRLVEFHPDGKTVQVKAYSPYYGTYKTDSQNQFQLTLQPPLF